MKMLLLDIDKLVKVNGIRPVTNPVSFDRGLNPSVDGLFSTEIFGMSTKERKRTCGYIPLNKHFISPKAYISLKRLDRRVINIVNGSSKFIIQDGELVESEDGNTGIEWLYENWEKISFKKNDSKKRNQRVEFLDGVKKEEIFITKLLVVPPFYRDVNLQEKANGGNPRIPEINNVYSAIIRNVNTLNTSSTFLSLTNSIIAKTQDLIVEVYNMWKEKLEKKYGYIRKFLLGKSISWCSRVVITADTEPVECPEDRNIDFFHTGVPLSQAISLGTPFIKYWIRRFFKTRLYDYKDKFPIVDKTGKTIYVKLENPEVYYNEDYIEKQMDRFIHTPSSRFDKIEVPIKRSEKEKYGIKAPIYITLKGYAGDMKTIQKEEDGIERPMTWTDMFFLATNDMLVQDKHVVVTRYPFVHHLNSIITKISVLSTRNTTPMVINDVLYENYPYVDTSLDPSDLEAYFMDSFKLNPYYLKAMTGDHDGDQITAKILFTKQANEEAETLMKSNTNIMAVNGGPVRTIGNELIQTLYTMTKFHDVA